MKHERKHICKKKLLIILIKQSLQHGTGARERSTVEEGVDLIHLTNVYVVHFNVELKFMKKKILVGFPPGIVAILNLLPFP